MNEIAEGDCEWPKPHPPHLWSELFMFPSGDGTMKVWACSGKAEDDDD